MVKALISGYYGYKNFGDETILKVLTEHLKSLDVDVTVISSDTEYTENIYGVKSVGNFDILSIIKAVKSADVLISGGGSLLQDVTSFKSLVYYLFIIMLGVIFNKKIIIFAQGIGPLNGKLSRIITKELLKYCSYISVRDENSLKLLSDWKINAKLVSDPVFSLNIKEMPKTNAVGIQLRECKSLNYTLLNKLAQLINEKFSDRKILLLSLQDALDIEPAKKFENILHTINPEIQTEIVSDNITERISGLEYLFAMRYHAIVIALLSGVKTCAINYDIKVEKLANDARIPLMSVSAQENFEKIYKQLEVLNSDELKNYAKDKKFDRTEFDRLFIV